jgi:hypothetical protein
MTDDAMVGLRHEVFRDGETGEDGPRDAAENFIRERMRVWVNSPLPLWRRIVSITESASTANGVIVTVWYIDDE